MAYVDTGIIISRYMPNDPMHKASELFFKKDLEMYITPLGLTELYSVLSRTKDQLSLSKEVKANVSLLSTLVNFIINHCNLTLVSAPYTVLIEFGDLSIRTSVEMAMSYMLAEKLMLRSLDLLHIATCQILKMEKGLDVFITTDEDIHLRREIIRKETGIKVKHLKEMV